MKYVPIEQYRKLCNESVELIKAKKKIEQLNIKIQSKDAMIEKLKTKSTGYAKLTPVRKPSLEKN